jgi:hypothetical protein
VHPIIHIYIYINSGSVSLEPISQEWGHRIKKNFEKWSVAKLPIKKVRPLMLFYGKILVWITQRYEGL